MPHTLLLALYDTAGAAAAAARGLHARGIDAEALSVVAATHEEEGVLSREIGATPGSDLEDSRPAGRVGELSARLLAAVALVLPGVGPILAAGPLAAELGEAAGHAAGGVASVLRRAGVDDDRALEWQTRVESGAILLGVHSADGRVEETEQELARHAPRDMARATWS